MRTPSDLLLHSSPSAPSSRALTVVLPEAPARTYLRWVARWREVEQVVRAAEPPHPVDGDAMFLRVGWASAFVSHFLAEEVADHALAAGGDGTAVSPRVHADRELLSRTIGYVERTQTWMQTASSWGTPQAASIKPLAWDLLILQWSMITFARAQLEHEEIPADEITVTMECPSCKSPELLKVDMKIERSPVAFALCESCGWESWQRDGEWVPTGSLLPVLAHA